MIPYSCTSSVASNSSVRSNGSGSSLIHAVSTAKYPVAKRSPYSFRLGMRVELAGGIALQGGMTRWSTGETGPGVALTRWKVGDQSG